MRQFAYVCVVLEVSVGVWVCLSVGKYVHPSLYWLSIEQVEVRTFGTTDTVLQIPLNLYHHSHRPVWD